MQPPPFWVHSCFIRLIAAEKELPGTVFKKQKPKGPKYKEHGIVFQRWIGFPHAEKGAERKTIKSKGKMENATFCKICNFVKGAGDNLVRWSTGHICRRA